MFDIMLIEIPDLISEKNVSLILRSTRIQVCIASNLDLPAVKISGLKASIYFHGITEQFI